MEKLYIILFIIVIGVIIQIIDIFQALINKKWVVEGKLSELFKLISTMIVIFLCVFEFYEFNFIRGIEQYTSNFEFSIILVGILLTVAMLIWSIIVILNYINKLFIMIINK